MRDPDWQAPYVGASAEATRQLAARAELDPAFTRLDRCGAQPGLVALAKRCLSISPPERPADANEVARAIGTLRTDAEERARRAEADRAAAEAKAAEQQKRRRVQALLGVVLALFTAAVGAGLWWVDRQRQENQFEKAQLVQQSRFDKLQIVTTAVARLEQLRDQAGAHPEYARTINDAKRRHAAWERAAFALEQSSGVLSEPEANDASVVQRIDDLRRDITTGVSTAAHVIDRTTRRVDRMESARWSIRQGAEWSAVREAAEAVTADPSSPESHLLHGDTLCRSGDYAAASASYRAARPLAAKHMPELLRDIDVRMSRAEYVAGTGSRLLTAWAGQPPSDPAGACDLAELCLIAGFYERAVGLYAGAFKRDRKLFSAHRITAALAATISGSGLGKWDGPMSPERRKQMRDLAEAWLPPTEPAPMVSDLKEQDTIPVYVGGGLVHAPGVSHLKELYASAIRLEGFDPNRYRFVRAILPAHAKEGDWSDVKVVPGAGEPGGMGFGTTVPSSLLLGSPYPGKSLLITGAVKDETERKAIGEFLNRVVKRHLLFDVACDALGEPPGQKLNTGWVLVKISPSIQEQNPDE